MKESKVKTTEWLEYQRDNIKVWLDSGFFVYDKHVIELKDSLVDIEKELNNRIKGDSQE